MPIKKKNFELYPDNWRKISWWIINIRANNKCEGCGAENHKLHPETGKMVTLSVAHLDHDPRNSDEDLDPNAPLEQSNMRAFCQRCHNRWDREHRNESIKQTYRQKHEEDITPGGLPPLEEPIFSEDDLIQWQAEQNNATLEQLQETLRQIILQVRAEEALEYKLMLMGIELRQEYMRLLALDLKAFGTPQVQTQLTVLRSKLDTIERLMGITRINEKLMDKIAAGAAYAPELIPAETGPLNVRGLGIRQHMLNKKNGTTE